MNVSQALSISSTFDVAKARNHFRKIADGNNWSPMNRMRLSAVITTLSEMALFKGRARINSLLLSYEIVESGSEVGVFFSCELPVEADSESHLEHAQMQLERTAGEVEIMRSGDIDHIVVRVWIE